MADDPKSTPPPAPHVHFPLVEEWSSISQGDLGLRAVYWTDDHKTAIASRTIVGWITFLSRRITDVLPNRGFAAIVIGDNWLPVLATSIPRSVCIAPKDVSDERVLERLLGEWKAGPNPAPSGLTN